MKLEEAKINAMGSLSDATPYFSNSRMIKVYFYHVLYYHILGPLSYFVVLIFSGDMYAKNIAFRFEKTLGVFYFS